MTGPHPYCVEHDQPLDWCRDHDENNCPCCGYSESDACTDGNVTWLRCHFCGHDWLP